MNRFSMRTLVFFSLIFLFLGACASLDKNVENIFLDAAIEQAARNIGESLNEKTIIAVLNFSSESEMFSEYVVDELSFSLVRMSKLTIVDRKHLDTIRNEMDFQLSGEVSDASIQSIGKFLGAQSVVTGSIQRIGKLYRIRFITLNVETAITEATSSFYLNKNDKIAFALLAEKTAIPSERFVKRSYFQNNGGSGIIIALLDMNSNNLPQNELWILNFLKGSIDSIFKRYSNVMVLDRSPEVQQRASEEMMYQYSNVADDMAVARLGRNLPATYVFVGTITKINNSEYSIQLRIVHAESGVQSATHTLICSLEQIRNTTATRKLSYELLTQMGVIFTENGRKALLEEI